MVDNSATASGTDPAGNTASDTSDDDNSGAGDTAAGEDDPTSTPLVQTPALELTKGLDASGVSTPAAVGDVLTYTFDVENTGNVALANVAPVDTMNLGPTGAGASVSLTTGPTLVAASDTNGNGLLDVTETFQYTATFVLTQAAIDAGGVHNTAVSTGDPVASDGTPLTGVAPVSDVSDNDTTANGVDGATGGPDDNPTVLALTPTPGIELVKGLDTAAVSTPPAVGNVLTYTFDVSNTGNVCLLYTSPSPRDATLSRMPSSA